MAAEPDPNFAAALEREDDVPLLHGYADEPAEAPKPRVNKTRFVVALCLAVAVVDIAVSLGQQPQAQILENIICDRHFASQAGDASGAMLTNDIPALPPAPPVGGGDGSLRCKIRPVEAELARINGYMSTFSTIPAVLLAVPYGILADKIGRRPVLILSMIGWVLSEWWFRLVCWMPHVFPLRLVWLSPIFLIIGGGYTTTVSMALVMVADVIDEDQRANIYFFFTSAAVASAIVGTPIAAYLMTINPWIPYLISAFIFTLCVPLMHAAVPETLYAKEVEVAEETISTKNQGILDQTLERMAGWKKAASFIWQSTNLLIIVALSLVGVLARSSLALLVIHVSTTFGWTIARASNILPVGGAVQLLLFMCLLPLLSRYITNHLAYPAPAKDLTLSRFSSLFVLVGMSIVTVATTPPHTSAPFLFLGIVVSSLGAGLSMTLRSFASSLVAPAHYATLFAAISTVGSAGGMAAGPAMAALFDWGMALGGVWSSLPFVVSLGLYAVEIALLWTIRPPKEALPA